MDASQRFTRLGLDEALDIDDGYHYHDEELPDYEASTAPAYDDGDYDAPYMSFHLRRYDRRIQILVSDGLYPNHSYRITTNSFRLSQTTEKPADDPRCAPGRCLTNEPCLDLVASLLE